jgi:hypothetical protein
MLEDIMAPTTHRSRNHLIAAKEAPIIVILQRKRAKLFHVITVGTDSHWVNEGSWFRGVLYALAVVYGRFERDGFARLGSNWGEEQAFKTPMYHVVCTGDDGWGRRPAPGYPELQVRYKGYLDSAFKFVFNLDEYPDLLEGANWATWDSRSNLWVARPGIVEQYTLKDLRQGTPSFSLDVDRFEPGEPPPSDGVR